MPAKEEVWTCRDGRKLKVADMSEDHAKSALRMLIRLLRKQQRDAAEPVETWEKEYWAAESMESYGDSQ